MAVVLVTEKEKRAVPQSRASTPKTTLKTRELNVEHWRVGRFKAFFEMQPAGEFSLKNSVPAPSNTGACANLLMAYRCSFDGSDPIINPTQNHEIKS